MTMHLTGGELVAALGGLLALVWVWRAGARRARRAADVARTGGRVASLAGRVVFTAAAITGVEWLVISHRPVNGWVVVAALAVPALLASYTLTRALTVTTRDVPRRRGGGRR